MAGLSGGVKNVVPQCWTYGDVLVYHDPQKPDHLVELFQHAKVVHQEIVQPRFDFDFLCTHLLHLVDRKFYLPFSQESND